MFSEGAQGHSPPPFLYFDNLPAWRIEPPSVRPPTAPPAPSYVHRSRYQPARTMGPSPSRGLLVVLLLLGLCVAAACWNAHPTPTSAQEQRGLDLRVEVPPPKFKTTSAEAPKLPALPPNTDKPRAEPPPKLVLPEMPIKELSLPTTVGEPLLPAPPEPNTLVPVVYNPGSLICSCFKDINLGDTPMKRNWNVIKMSSLLAAAMVASPVAAAGPAQDGQKDLKALGEQIDKMDKKIDKMNDDVNTAFGNLQVDLSKMKADIKAANESNKDNALKIETLQGSLQALRNEVEKLQGRDTRSYGPDKSGSDEIMSRLAKIEAALARMAADGRVSKAAPPPPSVGRILLVNSYPEDMLFVVNGEKIRVAAHNTTVMENQSAGSFLYDVISGTYGVIAGADGTRPSRQFVLQPGATYTITVH